MGLRTYGAAVIVASGLLWAMSSTGAERPVLRAGLGAIGALEAAVAAAPGDPAATRALAQHYLDARQPGLAIALLDGAPAGVRDDVQVLHLYARALVDEGRNREALDAEDRVLGACRPLERAETAPAGCDRSLFVSALRRSGILRELVALGVEDTLAHPEEALLAYQNATREARVALP